MAIKRPTSGLTPQDLEAGQFLIEGGEQGAVTNIPGMASAPRPVGVSTAPRPTTFDSFAPVARPSEESKELLGRYQARTEGGGPSSVRKAQSEAFDLSLTAEDRALKAKQAKEEAFRRQVALKGEPARMAGEQARLTETLKGENAIALQELKNRSKTEDLTAEDSRLMKELQSEERIATQGVEADKEQTAYEQKMETARATIKATGEETPQQKLMGKFALKYSDRMDGLEADLTKLVLERSDTEDEGERARLDAQIADKMGSIKILREDQNELASDLEASFNEQQSTASAATGEATDATTAFEAGEETTSYLDPDGDGQLTEQETDNVAKSRKIVDYVTGLSPEQVNALDETQRRKYDYAQAVMKEYNKKINNQAKRDVNGEE